MAIMFSGTRFHDHKKSCVRFRVQSDGELFECTIKDEGLKSLCDEYNDAMDIFDSCRMFILHCVWGIIHYENNCISSHVWIESLATRPAREGR
jgi:Protein of unknown function (DUF1488)